jgi:hypothetical protein
MDQLVRFDAKVGTEVVKTLDGVINSVGVEEVRVLRHL